VGVGAVADRPYRLTRAEQALTGTRLDASSVRAAVDDALAEIETWSDLHASADYRRRAAATLATRAILDAQAEANQRGRDAH
jgi:CO/xanthine dehydrogenase FAD-binding subunit